MSSILERIRIPHVYTLLVGVIFVCSAVTWVIPSGHYDRVTKDVGNGLQRELVVSGSYQTIEKNRSTKAALIGDAAEGKASPVSLLGFLTAVPRGMAESADIIFLIFILGGVFAILQDTGTIIAFLKWLLDLFGDNAALLTIILMTSVAVGGSLLGMGEEFIPLVPVFIMVSNELGYDRIYGLALVTLAADVGFAASTTNPFTVNVAQSIAGLELSSAIGFRVTFLACCLVVTIAYVLRYGRRIKANPELSLVYGDDQEVGRLADTDVKLTARHVGIFASSVLIFGAILVAVKMLDWWFQEMSGGFMLMGFAAILISGMSLSAAARSFVRGTEEMAVAALVVGFAKGIEVVLTDGAVLDTVIHTAASLLDGLPAHLAAFGMLCFQTTLNFFIPSGSGQAAVTMPLMAPLSDVLGLTRQTAVFAFTCGDGFSNTIIPTSGVLMAMLALAKIPYEKWLRFMGPLFLILMGMATIFLFIAVTIGLQ